jgi:predicted peptidase
MVSVNSGMATLLMLFAVAALPGPSGLQASYVTLFEAHEFPVPQESGPPKQLPYRLFLPDDQVHPMPLVVWLHGDGERGHDNVHQLRWTDTLMFPPPRQRYRYPFYLLVPQCPENARWKAPIGVQHGLEADDVLDLVGSLVREVLSTHRIDPERVTLTGLSTGGTACWEMAIRNPDLFAGVAPLASYGTDSAAINRLTRIPIWAFHSTHDSRLEPTVRATVHKLREANGVVQLSEVDGDGHNCWTLAFEDYYLLDWLLAQRRGQPRSSPPGTISWSRRLENLTKKWTLAQALGQAVVLAVSLVSVAYGVRVFRARGRTR